MSNIEELLEKKQISFELEPAEFRAFINKANDFEKIANLYNSERLDEYMSYMLELGKTINIESPIGPNQNNDSIVTKLYGNAMKRIIVKYKKAINKDQLILLLGALSKKYLEDTYKTSESEMTYTNGDIIILKNGHAFKQTTTTNMMQETSISELRDDLVEGILIVRKELQDYIKKNKPLSIKTIYFGRGTHTKEEELTFSLRELPERKDLIDKLSVNKIKELISKNLISNHDILKAAITGAISKTKALIFMKEGILSREEVLTKIFKVRDFSSIIKNKNINNETKMFIYSIGEVGIKDLEKNIDTSKQISTQCFEEIAKYYDKKKIGELLTHDVLSYIDSKHFIETLMKEEIITKEDAIYFEKIMEDFKCKELLNATEVESIAGESENIADGQGISRVTIDPNLRLKYFSSIGSVKRVKINGQIAILDNEGSKRKVNSLDGYELLIIPDKKVAILEKCFEVTRDKKGNMIYKKNSKGENIPAMGNATYILPIGFAKDFVENKNKKDLIQSPYVYRAFHTMNWVKYIEEYMKRINPEIEFEKVNTDIWQERIAKDYKQRKKEDIKE